MEAVAKADTIVFDKTGTLTYATPTVAAVVPFGGHDEAEMCISSLFNISVARFRTLFIRLTHSIWSPTFSVSVMPSASAICFTIRRKSAASGSLPRRRFSVADQSEHFTAKPPLKKKVFVQYLFGGPEGIRTLDLSDANRTLSQLSYKPVTYLIIIHISPQNARGFSQLLISISSVLLMININVSYFTYTKCVLY